MFHARLADLFEGGGCPLCRHGERSAARFLESMLWERVSDVGFQRELVEARGFCPRHTHEVVIADRRHMGGTLGSAILFGTVLRERLRELEDARRHAGRTRGRRLEAARAAPTCPACAQCDAAVSDAVAGLIEVAADPAWSEALAAAPFCLDHLERLMIAGAGADPWRTIEDRQVARLRALADRLASFVHHSSHDRRHLLTEDELRAADSVEGLLGGNT